MYRKQLSFVCLGKTTMVMLRVGYYQNGRIAIELLQEGLYGLEPFVRVTVNLLAAAPLEANEALLTTLLSVTIFCGLSKKIRWARNCPYRMRAIKLWRLTWINSMSMTQTVWPPLCYGNSVFDTFVPRKTVMTYERVSRPRQCGRRTGRNSDSRLWDWSIGPLSVA